MYVYASCRAGIARGVALRRVGRRGRGLALLCVLASSFHACVRVWPGLARLLLNRVLPYLKGEGPPCVISRRVPHTFLGLPGPSPGPRPGLPPRLALLSASALQGRARPGRLGPKSRGLPSDTYGNRCEPRVLPSPWVTGATGCPVAYSQRGAALRFLGAPGWACPPRQDRIPA